MRKHGHGASRLKPERSARSDSAVKGSGVQRKKVINGIARGQVPKNETDEMDEVDAIAPEQLKQGHRILDITDSGIKKGRCGYQTAPAALQSTFVIVAVVGISSNNDVVNQCYAEDITGFLEPFSQSVIIGTWSGVA